MAEDGVLTLTVKSLSGQGDAFEVDVPESETVEALVVIIFSLRPDLGEELRVCHRQRALKPEAVLKDAGVRSGDVVVVARRPKAKAADEAAPDAAAVAAAAPAAAASPEAEAQEEACLPGQCPPSYWEALHSRFPSGRPAAEPAFSPPARSHPAQLAAAPAEPAGLAPPAEEAAAGAAGEEEAKDRSGLSEVPEEVPPSVTLEHLAERFEAGLADAHPGELAALLRRTALRVRSLEGGLGEMGQVMEMMHILSGRALHAFGAQTGGEEQGGIPRMQAPRQQQEEVPRSFMVKKGDADVQEMHRAAAAQRPSQLARQTSGGSSAGGTLSHASTPMSKEEMDKARRARLMQLEQQQAEKVKEQEEAEAKAKAREAMLNSFQVGPAKPLGKF